MSTGREPQHICCRECQNLITDILFGFLQSNPRWHTIQSLSYLLNHRYGKIDSLENQGDQTCQVCKLIHEKVSELCGTRSASRYRIFVWNRQPQNCQFQITVDEVTVFFKHVTQWRPLKSLTLFGLDTLTPSWPDLGDVDLFNKAKVFRLPLLPNPLPRSPEACYQARS
jgi:hypothetical protein